MHGMHWLCLALGGVALLVSLPLAWVGIGVGGRWGHEDRADSEAHKVGGRRVPTTGGVAIFLAVTGPLGAMLLMASLVPEGACGGRLSPLGEYMNRLRQETWIGVGIIVAMVVMHVTGLADDRHSLGAGVKLTVQIVVAAILVCFFQMRVLRMLDQFGGVGEGASVLISVLWIVTITNAMNFLDNMDGLSGGVGAIIAGLYLAATLVGGQWFVAGLSAILLGALVGFLVFNFPPAKLFMGDAGSLVVGLLLAVISIRTAYVGVSVSNEACKLGAWYGLLMPLMVMAVPLYDFVSVLMVRLAQGRNPMHGDRSHFSHRLVRRGLSPRAAVVVIWGCTFATGLSGVMLGKLAGWQAALAAAQTAAMLTVLALIEGKTRGEKGKL